MLYRAGPGEGREAGHLVEGCQLGGGHLPAVLAPLEALEELAGPPQVIGQGQAPLHLQSRRSWSRGRLLGLGGEEMPDGDKICVVSGNIGRRKYLPPS